MHSTTDLAKIITDAMHFIGKSDLFNNGHSLDNHSTITLELEDMPAINIGMSNDMPMIWANFGVYDKNYLAQHHEALMSLTLSQYFDFFYPCQPGYYLTEESELELRGSFTPHALSSGENMANALNTFFSVLYETQKIFI